MNTDLKTFLLALLGGVVATLVGPVVLTGLGALLNATLDILEVRLQARESDRATRVAAHIVAHMRRNPGQPGRTYIYEEAHEFGPEMNSGENDEMDGVPT